MKKEDCILYHEELKKCTGLKETYCEKEEDCAFYKSIAEYKRDGRKRKREQ